MPITDSSDKASQEKLLKRALAYQNTLAFFCLATLCPKTKETTNELLENYTTVLRIHREQDTNNPKIDITYALTQLEYQSQECIKSHSDLTTFYAMQPSPEDVLFKPIENYYNLWKKSRQRG